MASANGSLLSTAKSSGPIVSVALVYFNLICD